jgi:hypothetical protein
MTKLTHFAFFSALSLLSMGALAQQDATLFALRCDAKYYSDPWIVILEIDLRNNTFRSRDPAEDYSAPRPIVSVSSTTIVLDESKEHSFEWFIDRYSGRMTRGFTYEDAKKKISGPCRQIPLERSGRRF